MGRRKLSIFGLASLAVVSLAGTVASTIAWFRETITLSPDVVTGAVQGAYYAGGDGSAGNPFQIHDPIHLYNLAWLQYFGTYNKFTSNTLTSQRYFVVTADLDMTGWTLPPIGTEDYPFLGKFDGSNHTITGLTTTNEFDIGSGVKTPQKFTGFGATYHQPKIVGFFGVVGKLPGETYTYTSANNQMINYTLNGTKVESRTAQTLIGIAAGYVNATMSGVKVTGAATIDVNRGTASTAVDASNITEKLSDYGLVGYSTNLVNSGSYSQKLSEYYNNDDDEGEGGTGGDEAEYGGSINPRAYSRMIYDHYKMAPNAYGLVASTMSNNVDYTLNSTPSGNFKIVFRSTAQKTQIYTKDASQYSYYNDPDYFNSPLDGATVRNVTGKQVLYHVRDGAYIPLRFSDSTNTDTREKNTGFIIGSNSGNAGSPKFAAGYVSNIMNAFGNTAATTSGTAASNYTNLTYSDSNLQVITYSTKLNNWYLVEDSHNAGVVSTNSVLTNLSLTKKSVSELEFEKYDKSRNSLKTVLETAPRLNAVKFDNTTISSSNLLNVTSGTIKKNGESFSASSSSPYQFPKGSIDFHLKKTGFINFFAGTYYLSTTHVYNYSFFTLNHITRSGGTISSIKKISKIYRNKYWNSSVLSGSSTNPKFFYKYSDDTFSSIIVNGNSRAATISDRDTSQGNDGLVFDTSYALESPMGTSNVSLFKKAVNNLVFYFEVPVNDGEYAMGMAENPDPTIITSFTGAYMMYLDIGANGDTIATDKLSAYFITTKSTGNPYPFGVDFAPITVSGNGGDSMGVSIDSGKKGVLTLTVSTSNISVTDTSSISKYSFRSNKYVISSPSSSQFTCNLSGAPPSTAAGGNRVLIIELTTTDESEYTIRITDELSDDAGTIASSAYEIDYHDDDGFIGDKTVSDVTSLSNEINLSNLRSLTIVTTLTRASGISEFATTYDVDHCSYANKVIDVDVTLDGCTATVGEITTGYAFKVGGVAKVEDDVIS